MMETSFKGSHAHTAALSTPNPAAGHHWPRLCQRLLDTHGQGWISLFWCHCYFLLGPGAPRFCPPRVYFPVLYKFWWLYGGVNGDLLQKGLCHTQVCCTQSPCPWSSPLLPCTSTGDTQTQIWLSLCRLSGSWCTRFVWAPQVSLVGMGFDSKCDFTPPTTLLRLLLCPEMWGIFSWWAPTFSCQQLFSTSCNFWVLTGDEHTSFYSTILSVMNAEFQRIARRDKITFSDQCKETEENSRIGKTRDLFKKIRDMKRIFHAKMGTIKDRNGMDLQKILRGGGKNTQKNCTKKIFMTQIIMMVWSLTWNQTSWNVKSSGP